MRKRTTIRLITFLSAAVVVAGIFAYQNTKKANALELYARANTQHAFDELVTSVSELSNALEKSQYLSDPALESALCTQIFGRAATAQMAVGVLPYSSQELEQTSSFVAKVGDYANVLARTVGKNGGYSKEELKNLQSLAQTASVMKLNLQDLQSRILDGSLTMEEVYESADAVESDGEQAPLAGTAFQAIEQEFPEIPTLIYDGPFSESMTKKKALFLDGREEIGKEDAVKAASKFLDADDGDLEASGECGGDVPCWVCTGRVKGNDYTVYVTKQGGEIWNVMCSRAVGQQSYSVKQGLNLVRDYINSWGIQDLEESYHTMTGGILLVNFQHSENGVRCYPDLIKVGVALDNGTLMSYDAKGYISSHRERDIPNVSVKKDDAQKNVSQSLSVKSHNMAIIPSDGGEERFCHEFVCETEAGEHYILYVNAETGAEERILILLEDENGALTV